MKNKKINKLFGKILVLIFIIYFLYTVIVQQKTLNSYAKERDKYNDNIDNIISETIENTDYSSIHSEEDLYCYIIDKSLENLEDLLLREELAEKEYQLLQDTEKVKDYISSRLSDVDINIIWQRRMYQYTSKQKEENLDFATEKISNNTKSDDSTVNILNELNSIFFD